MNELLTYVVKFHGKIIARIVCGSNQSFEEIRQKYFPDLPANKWSKDNGTQQKRAG